MSRGENCKTFMEKFTEIAESQQVGKESAEGDEAAGLIENLSVEDKKSEEKAKEEEKTPAKEEEKEDKEEEKKPESNCYSVNRVDDAERFHAVKEALDIVHVSKEDQESVFAMLAAVLWLGNVSFTIIDNENHVEPEANESLSTVAKLIGCNINELKLALSKRNMRVRNDTIVQKLTLSQAIDARDALAKSIYASLFDWLVEQINKSLAVRKRRTGRSISILDIYGFESFDVCFYLVSLCFFLRRI